MKLMPALDRDDTAALARLAVGALLFVGALAALLLLAVVAGLAVHLFLLFA